MRGYALIISLLFCTQLSWCQVNSSTFLTWMKGDNTTEQPGIYGSRGVADIINKPGARDFSATWRDSNGNLWLFGGYGLDKNGQLGYLNDLWKFDPLNNKWTWIKGDNISGQPGMYGQQGVANNNNKPGAIYAAVSWTDASGNLWLFGGFGYTTTEFGFLNDLWKYNIATNQWTWIKGDNDINHVATYGTQGSSTPNTKPGSRYGSRTWTDDSGNLWLFGGYGYDNSAAGNLNDLWKYIPSTNRWTWIKGDNSINQPGVYGQKGVTATSNRPGGRYVSVSWTDASNNFWLFGGYGNTANGEGDLDDLWKYNMTTNQWTWISGDNMIGTRGAYGVRGVADSTSRPGARYVSVSWTDESNDLWLFGGYGFDSNNEGYLNDLWRYDPATDQWTWIKGDNIINQYGVYGTQGMITATNKSGARNSSVSWTDNFGHLWFFGGYGYDDNSSGMLNDLWKISILLEPLPLKLISFNGTLKNDATLLQWQTVNELNFSHFIIQRSFDGIHFTDIGTKNGNGNTVRNDYSYPDNDLRNTNEAKIFYRLKMMNTDSSFEYSKIIRFDRKQPIASVHVFPNPASHFVDISFDQPAAGTTTINITDIKGTIVKSRSEKLPGGRTSINIDVSSLPSALYIISVTTTNGTLQQKFIKQ